MKRGRPRLPISDGMKKDIRDMYFSNEVFSLRFVAKHYGISVMTVWRIVNDKRKN